MPNKVLFFTNIFPHYRAALWEKLVSSEKFEIHFYFSKRDKFGIKLGDINSHRFKNYKSRFHIIKNIYLGKYLFFQSKVIYKSLFSKYDTILFTGESQVITTWLGSLIAKARKKKVVFWGHGLYGSETRIKKLIRNLFNRIPSIHLVYEKRAKKLLISNNIDESRIQVIYNSLDFQLHSELYNTLNISKKSVLSHYFKTPELITLIFSGRLIESKKIELLIKAVYELNKTNVRYNLLIVGDGPLRRDLENLSQEGILNKWIYFHGSCYDEKTLAELFMSSDLCISPGNVGLLAIQSLSFGTPICTHSNHNNQMPEIEIIRDGENGFLFEEDNIVSLINTIQKIDFNIDYTDRCRKNIEEFYNPIYQYSIFEEVILNEK